MSRIFRIYMYIYIYIYNEGVASRRDLHFGGGIYLFCSYIRVCFQVVAFVREHIWHKTLLMEYSIRLELIRVRTQGLAPCMFSDKSNKWKHARM